jgi:hypothetical protein
MTLTWAAVALVFLFSLGRICILYRLLLFSPLRDCQCVCIFKLISPLKKKCGKFDSKLSPRSYRGVGSIVTGKKEKTPIGFIFTVPFSLCAAALLLLLLMACT